MRTFRYFPPGPEEQRAFVIQLVGTILGLAVVVALTLRQSNMSLRAWLWGAGLGALWLLGRSAWQLETKARRAQRALIGIEDAGLSLTDANGQTQTVAWNQIEKCDMAGGRLMVVWPDGKLVVGAREIEDGMTLVREIARRREGKASNVIALEPKN